MSMSTFVGTETWAPEKPADEEPACLTAKPDCKAWPRLPWTVPTAKERWEERKSEYTDDQREQAWSKTADIVKTYSDEIVRRWNQEIDTLLVFAGLFSAILSSFTVQSYQLLTPAPMAPVVTTLLILSSQLLATQSANSTQGSLVELDATQASSNPRRWVVWLNALWFSSLILSLSSALIGIMVKQWLNEYNSGLSGTSRQIARLRQARLANLDKWHVAAIVAILPILLQVALALFFAGLLVLLWALHYIVAIVASIFVGILAIFAIGSMILPAFRSDCCYLSPSTHAIYNFIRSIRAALFLVRRPISRVLRHMQYHTPTWTHPAMSAAWIFLWTTDESFRFTWRGRELHRVARSAEQLDASTVTTAYSTTMDTGYLDVAAICFTDLSTAQVVNSALGIHAANAKHAQDRSFPLSKHAPAHVWSDVWLALHSVRPCDRDAAWMRHMQLVYHYLRWSNLPADVARSSAFAKNIASSTSTDGNLPAALRNEFREHKMPLDDEAQRRIAVIAERFLRNYAQTPSYLTLLDTINTLRTLLDCAHPRHQDTGGGDTAEEIRKCAFGALTTVMHAVYEQMQAGVSLGEWMEDLFDLLRRHVRPIPSELVDMLPEYVAAYERQCGKYPWSGNYREWVRRLVYETDRSRTAHIP